MDNNLAWWHKDCTDPAAAVVSSAEKIDLGQEDWYRSIERTLRMYGQHYNIGDSVVTDVYTPAREKLMLNVTRSIVDSIHSDISQNRPRPMFLTGGDGPIDRWKLQRKARKLEQAVDGIFNQCNVHRVMSEAALDALIMPAAGVIKVYAVGEEIKVERVLPFEIMVDKQEGLYCEPKTMYRRKFYDREVLRGLFPGKDEAIDDGQRPDSAMWYTNGDDSDIIQVFEAWRLPCKGKPGKHIICTHGGALLEEKWEHDFFPFVFFRWARQPIGFWGDSVANQLTGIQYEINMLMKNIQDAHHLLGKAYILWPDGCGALKPTWNNGIGWVLRVATLANGEPQVITPSPVSPEIYRQLERLYQYAYEIVGANMLQAQAKKPTGLDSGRALLVFEDATSMRFLVSGRAYEQMAIDITKIIVALMKEIYKDNKQFKVKWGMGSARRQFINSIPWADVDMKEDMFHLQTFPVSNLPKTPAGRTAQVEQWINVGWIGREEGMKLLDFPDVDEYTNLTTASWDVINKDLENILDMDPEDAESLENYSPPMPLYDLNLALKLATGCFLTAHRDDAPMEIQSQLLRYIEDVKFYITQDEMEQAAKLQAMQGPPPGGPGPMPPGPPGPMPPMPPGPPGPMPDMPPPDMMPPPDAMPPPDMMPM